MRPPWQLEPTSECDTQAAYKGGTLEEYYKHLKPYVNKNKLNVTPLAHSIETFRYPGSVVVLAAFVRAIRPCGSQEAEKGCACVREQYSSSFCVPGRRIVAT